MKFCKCCILLITFILSISPNLNAQNRIDEKKLFSNFVKSENKEKYYTNLVKNVDKTFAEKLNNNYEEWIKALRDAQSIYYKNDLVKSGVSQALNLDIDENKKLQRVSLEVSYTLYQNEFADKVENIFTKTTDPVSFSVALLYLKNFNSPKISTIDLTEVIKNRFPDFDKNGVLKNLYYEFENKNKINIPNLKELFNHNFQKGAIVVYSIQRKNRNYPGLVIIKKPEGTFVKNNDSTIFSSPQLALSYSNLPGYIPNGNTPQGIYSIVGWYISPTETIGPTPNLLLRSPFEVSTQTFYHNKQNSSKWNIDDYKNLLPESWKNFFPIFESYYAGKSGRKLIIAHGSTDEIKYYNNLPFYPLTPTRGCLSSKEIWSEETGYCIESDQAKLINAVKSTGKREGFLIVFEIDNKNEPVKLEEIKQFIN